MFLTEREIFSQYKALKQTYELFVNARETIKQAIDMDKINSITFIGCGSSYALCQSAEITAKKLFNLPVHAVPAGDLLLNFPHYEKILKKTLLVAPSRSGSTSEVLKAVALTKQFCDVFFVSISAKENSELSEISHLNIEIPWAFDESICQTRTVTNLYTANLLLLASIGDVDSLFSETKAAIESGEDFQMQYKEMMMKLGYDNSWSKVVVLADSDLHGIGTEGALTFKEISQLDSNSYHLLDVRHGPMVMIDKNTLVIAVCSEQGENYQKALFSDIQKKAALLVIVCNEQEHYESDIVVKIPKRSNYAVYGIPFIFVPQAISFYKALALDVNPDLPQGLDAWIKL